MKRSHSGFPMQFFSKMTSGHDMTASSANERYSSLRLARVGSSSPEKVKLGLLEGVKRVPF